MIIGVKEGSREDYERERLKCVVFVAKMNNKIESINYLFSDNNLKLKLKKVLERYVNVLERYDVLFYELQGL